MFLDRRIAIPIAVGALAALTSSAGATTLMRQSLEGLTRTNELIVVGTVQEIHSYWNPTGTHVLTDVQIQVDEALKGAASAQPITITLLGGTVGEWSTVLIGGPELVPGNQYVLFLSRGELPGAEGQWGVIDFGQGVFDVTEGSAGRTAVSQAADDPLMADSEGRTDVPGGATGLSLVELSQQIRAIGLGR